MSLKGGNKPAQVDATLAKLRYDRARKPSRFPTNVTGPQSLVVPLTADLTPTVGSAGTFSRASVTMKAANVAATGMASVANNTAAVPAFPYNVPVTNGGVQLCGPRKNLYTYNNNLAHANWTAYLSPTRTANTTDVLAPDGTQTATKFLNNAADEGCNQTAMAVAASGKKIIHSVWARVGTGTGNFYVGSDTTTSQGYTSSDYVIDTTWRRYSHYHAYGAVTGNIRPAFYCGDAGTAYYLWGAQCEVVDDATNGTLNKEPTVHVPTAAAAVTSVADSLTYPLPATIRSKGRISIWHMPFFGSVLATNATDRYVVDSGNINIRYADSALKATFGGVTLTANTQAWVANEYNLLTLTWDATQNSLKLFKNGEEVANSSSTLVPTTETTLTLGTKASAPAASEYADGIFGGLIVDTTFQTAAAEAAYFEAKKLDYGYEPSDPPILSFDRTAFTEAAGNTGAITESAVITLQNDIWSVSNGPLTTGTHYTVTGLPSGLGITISVTSATTAQLTFSGSATNHAVADSVSGVSVSFLPAAFLRGQAASNPNGSLSITFLSSEPHVVYSRTAFDEASANDGSITQTCTMTITNDTLVTGPLVANTHYTISNVCAGLTASLARTSAGVATLSFTGTATNHAFANSVSNVVFTWLAAAFTGGAIPVDGSQTQTFSVNFVDPVAASGSINLRGTTYSINAHPRLWYTAARQTALVARSVLTNYVWATLKARCDSRLASAATNYFIYDALNFTVAYYGTNKATTTYRDAAITILLNCTTFLPNYDYGSIDLHYFALCYDWLYADMSAGQRAQVRDYIHDQLLPHLYTHPANHHNPASWAPPSHNLNITKACGELAWSLAAMDDDITRANPLVQYNYDHWLDKMWGTASFAGADVEAAGGRTWSGSHYGPSRVMQYWGYVCDQLATSLLDPDTNPIDWKQPVLDYLTYWIHSLLPPETTYMHAEWEPGAILIRDQGSRLTQTLLPMVQHNAGGTDSQYVQYWLVNKFFPQLIAADYIGLWHIWYDPSTSAADYSAAPLSYSTTGTSVGFSRTAWNTATSSFLSFSCADYVGDHQVQTVGDYKIFRAGEFVLINNAPRYASGNPSGSSADPSYCNIYVAGSGLVSGVQTGGQYLRTPGVGTASIDKRTEGTTFCYMRGNMTNAYSSTTWPHSYIHRNVCHFRATAPSVKDFFVFMDVVNSTNSIAKAEQMYVPKAPTVAGSQAYFTLTNNKCIIEKVLPSGATLSQVAVTDRATHTDVPQSASDAPTKLLISDSAGNYAAFLWVVHTGATDTTMPTLTALSGAAGQLIGVHIADNPDRIYMGSKDNQTHSGTFTVASGHTAPCEWVISGLVAGDKYDFTNAGTPTFTKSGAGALTVDAQGVLTHTELAA